ncbi:MAG: AbiV family abortive infection protein [Bacteroidetes bacterium]|nr:AbiV family abortive infection protein [Bacteroidota bacterium]
MSLITFQNCLRLHLDSIVMFNNKSFPSAYYLSIISLEELGKIFILADFLFNSRVNGRFNEYKDPELLKIFGDNFEEGYFRQTVYNHHRKQYNFVRTFDSDYKPTNKYYKDLLNGLIEQKKQNSLYVGLKRNKSKIDMNSRIINPNKISVSSVFKQIELMHKSILELIICVGKEFWTTDSDNLDEYLNEQMYYDIKPRWEIKKKSFIKRLEKLEVS